MPWRCSVTIERARRVAEPVPRGGHHQHPVADPQVAGNEVHRRHVAAMAGDDHQLAQAGAVEAFADLGIGADDRLRRKRQRAGVSDVLVRLADFLHRQEADRQVVRQKLMDAREVGFGDVGIDPEREMGAVLLHRRHRQDRDPAPGVGFGQVRPCHVHPVTLRQHLSATRLSRDARVISSLNPERTNSCACVGC